MNLLVSEIYLKTSYSEFDWLPRLGAEPLNENPLTPDNSFNIHN